MTLLTLIRKNLFRKKTRTILLLVAIFTAFLIYGVLAAFNIAFNSGVNLASANRLVVVNKINFTQPMPFAYVNRIAAVKGVKDITYADWFGGFYKEARNEVMTFAVEPESYLRVVPEIVLSDEEKKAFLQDRTGAIIGKMTAERFGWKVGDRVPISSSIYAQAKDGSRSWTFAIRGIFTSSRPEFPTNYLLFNHDYFNETRNVFKDTIGWVMLLTADTALNEQVIRDIDSQFANSPNETETTTEEAFNKAFLEQIGSIGFIITSVTGAAFATILMIVGNSMYRATQERTREFAILKTIGFTSTKIFALVLAESFALVLLGGIMGLITACTTIYVIGPLVVSILPGMVVTWQIIVKSLIYILLLGLITGVIPAWQAMRCNIITGLGKTT